MVSGFDSSVESRVRVQRVLHMGVYERLTSSTAKCQVQMLEEPARGQAHTPTFDEDPRLSTESVECSGNNTYLGNCRLQSGTQYQRIALRIFLRLCCLCYLTLQLRLPHTALLLHWIWQQRTVRVWWTNVVNFLGVKIFWWAFTIHVRWCEFCDSWAWMQGESGLYQTRDWGTGHNTVHVL